MFCVVKSLYKITTAHFIIYLLMGESNTIVSAYTVYRHLQQYCSHPSLRIFQLIVTNTDGSPAPGEDIQISASSGYDSYLYSPYVGIRPPHEKKYSWKKKFTSDEDGVVHFVIIDVDPSIGFLSLTVNT